MNKIKSNTSFPLSQGALYQCAKQILKNGKGKQAEDGDSSDSESEAQSDEDDLQMDGDDSSLGSNQISPDASNQRAGLTGNGFEAIINRNEPHSTLSATAGPSSTFSDLTAGAIVSGLNCLNNA